MSNRSYGSNDLRWPDHEYGRRGAMTKIEILIRKGKIRMPTEKELAAIRRELDKIILRTK